MNVFAYYCECVCEWGTVIAVNAENSYLVFIYAEKLLHWSIGTERETERDREGEGID